MARVALDHLLLGDHGQLAPGDEVPASFTVGGSGPHETDFARLEELGLVEPAKKARAAKADEAE